MKNMELWKSVCETDPKYVKNFRKGGGFSGSSPNATYVVRRLTEIFGPAGIGWGMEITESFFQEGHIIEVIDGIAVKHVVHICRGRLWYMWEGEKRFTSEQFGQTDFVGKNKYGLFTDEEAPKKTITDLRGKLASTLGFCSDIHLGMWDDNKYIAYLRAKGQQEEKQKQNSTAKDQKETLESWIKIAMNQKDESELVAWYRKFESRIMADLDHTHQKKFLTEMKDIRAGLKNG